MQQIRKLTDTGFALRLNRSGDKDAARPVLSSFKSKADVDMRQWQRMTQRDQRGRLFGAHYARQLCNGEYVAFFVLLD